MPQLCRAINAAQGNPIAQKTTEALANDLHKDASACYR
jgi:hypothetical protein